MKQDLEQGRVIELEIRDLNTSGEGVGRYQGKVVFVPDTVTGDRVKIQLTQIKAKYARGKLKAILDPSPHRIRPHCIVADKCGGCQWQHISPKFQREAKRQQLIQSLERIGGFADVSVAPILHTPNPLNYRNKSTYPLARSSEGQVQAGYYRSGSHKLINLNQCPVQDERLHPLLKEVKQDIQEAGWSIYNEDKHRGKLRHLSLRIGVNTGEILLTLISTSNALAGIEERARVWLERYPQLVGVCLNLNPERTNVIFGKKTQTIAGKSSLKEIFAGIELYIGADTFFQINTKTAELLLNAIAKKLNFQGTETLLDAYCGIGTFSLPLAAKVKQVIGVEISSASIERARQNAEINNINNVTFHASKVKSFLAQIVEKPDIILLDPPRKGCDRQVIENILRLSPAHIVYVSCKPATLARDLKILCQSGNYRLDFLQPADFFPQTTHVESLAILQLQA